MSGETLVAVYASRAEAERVRDRLRSIGAPESDVRLSIDTDNDQRFAPVGGESGSAASPLAPKQEEGFFDWLFGSSVPEADRTWYGSNLREGRTALSVHLRDDADRQRIEDILEESDPIEFDRDEASAPAPRIGIAGDLSGTSQPVVGSAATSAAEERAGTSDHPAATEDEQVIPVAKEELHVGKRVVERRQRIRVYVVERPVEEQVTLRDETVEIERRPVSGERPVDPDTLQERTIEVIERDEEPVVEKAARAIEEVAVHKEAAERTETVRDTVRETEVEVDREGTAGHREDRVAADKMAAGSKPGVTSGTSPGQDERSVGERLSDKAHDLKEDVKDTLAPDKKV
jgi:stress response protein YsnF